MNKIVSLLIPVLIILSMASSAFAENDMERYVTEFEAFRPVRDMPLAYEPESWAAYNKVGKIMLRMDPENLTEKNLGQLDSIEEARKALVQTGDPAQYTWYIWGDTIPMAEGVGNVTFKPTDFDGPDFKPFLVPYLLENQDTAKGNIIVIAGGGYTERGNDGDGYPVAERFRELGYNCYVLQRRVAPYCKEDIWMDLQRALRYLKFHAETLEIGARDRWLAIGFSGGSRTLLGEIAHCYGDIQPTIYDETYKPDEIDAVNADFDAVCAIYGPNYEEVENYEGIVTDNENLPEIFIAAGQLDQYDAGKESLTLAQSLFDRTKVELHLYANAYHAFTFGMGNNNTATWVGMADAFFGRIGD